MSCSNTITIGYSGPWKRHASDGFSTQKGKTPLKRPKQNVEFDILVCAEVQKQVYACLYRTGSGKNVYLFWSIFRNEETVMLHNIWQIFVHFNTGTFTTIATFSHLNVTIFEIMWSCSLTVTVCLFVFLVFHLLWLSLSLISFYLKRFFLIPVFEDWITFSYRTNALIRLLKGHKIHQQNIMLGPLCPDQYKKWKLTNHNIEVTYKQFYVSYSVSY